MKTAAPDRRRDAEQVLVIDDDRGICDCLELLLGRAGFGCVITRRGADGLAQLRGREFDLVITDLRLPDASGLDIVAESKALHPGTQVILMTSFSSVESAIEALRRGADDYVIKPFDNDDLLFSVQRALETRRTRMENAALKRSLRKAIPQSVIIGQSESVLKLQAMIARVAATDANVLIQGESGTGKELGAQAIHAGGPRGDKPFVAINCGAIPAELIESELFGHAKGAFTGAATASDGLIREASGGTLFLDEISEMPLQVQVKLLRVLQERQVRPLGSSQSYITDTRFLAATNRDLKERAEAGHFRPDLYYRLNVIAIHVPPLRGRGRDIELLAQHFLQQFSRRFGARVTGMDEGFVEFLHRHPWPGNVRELQNVIERAVILADGPVLTTDDLGELALAKPPEPRPGLNGTGRPLSVEDYIREVVTLYQDRYGEAELAQMLGIGRKALWMRRRSWGLQREGRRGGHEGAGAEIANDAWRSREPTRREPVKEETVDVLTPAVILAQTRFFRELNPHQLAGVAALADPLQYDEGQTVYRFGEAAHWFYVLSRGTVRLTTGHGGRHASVGDLLGRGDVFGWAALTPHCSLRIATATCVTHCKMLAIDGTGLLARMEADHTLGYRLMTQLNLLVTGTLSAFAGG